MRISPVRDLLSERGAVFESRAGTEIALRFSSFEEEYTAVREAVGLSDFSFATRFSVPESGLDMLEKYAAGAVSNIRFGRVMHTLSADERGFVESDLYIANDDEQLVVIGESLIDDDATAARLNAIGAGESGLEDLTGATALFGIDGYKAWAVAKELFGADVLGLPYLSIETYDLDGEEVKLIRAGKTSEFGYLLLVPAGSAPEVWKRIEKAGEPHGLRCVGAEAHGALRLDGRFFNIYEEGAKVKDPLELGLQWMIDFGGDDFTGKEAIMERRQAGPKSKVIGVTPASEACEFAEGTEILLDGEPIAEVITARRSPTLGHEIGLAKFEWRFAYSGLEFDSKNGGRISTISMPPITPKSLSVKLDEM